MTTLLIDADVLLYRFAHSEQVVVRWERDLYMMWAELEPAKVRIDLFINEMLHKSDCDEARLVLSDVDRSYRKEQITHVAYKAERAGVVRPMIWKPLREWFLGQEWNARWEPTLEGDDMLGLLSSDDMVMGSTDKDLHTVPGLHFNWDRADRGVYMVPPEQAMDFFLMQVLTGDSVDGYKGIPGVGPVAARKILEKANKDLIDPWEAIVKAYEKAGLTAEAALDTARCAWVLRGDDFDFDTKTVRLWTPDRLEA